MLTDAVGLVGVGLILGAYTLLQTRRIASTGVLFSLLNALGSGMILFSLVFTFNLPSAIVEGAWLMISLYGIGRAFRGGDHIDGDGDSTDEPTSLRPS